MKLLELVRVRREKRREEKCEECYERMLKCGHANYKRGCIGQYYEAGFYSGPKNRQCLKCKHWDEETAYLLHQRQCGWRKIERVVR